MDDITKDILKDLAKEQTKEGLCKKYKLSPRILEAVLSVLIEDGFLISHDEKTVKLCKDILPQVNEHTEEWAGEKIIRFGAIADTHLCNKWSQITFLHQLYDTYKAEEITTVYHGGDLADGWYKDRPGHIFELVPGCVGLDEQADYITKIYPNRQGVVTKFITGNHDHTHIKNGGGDIGRRIAAERKDLIYLGQNNARIELTPNCIMELNHPGDGSSYALSYALQKLIDSLTGGQKPNVLFNAHHHKAFYMPKYRNIHAFEMGTTEDQTPFMKSKRISADVGGWIVEIHVDDEGTITRCKGEFIPYYKMIKDDYLNWQ